jgi:hypothetical protein
MEGLNEVKSVNTDTKEVVTGTALEGKQVLETNAKGAPVSDVLWNTSEINTESETKLEDDKGEGGVAIIRKFEFAANPIAFKQYKPTKQELFNSHAKQIEIMLWQDGMKLLADVNPKITINKSKTKYRIFVGAEPQKGHLLREVPKTLSQITHGH